MNQAGTIGEVRDIGVCNVNYNSNNVGYTQGGVTVGYTNERYTRNIDAFGIMNMGEYDRGSNIFVTLPLLEESITKFTRIMPEGTVSGTTLTFGRYSGTKFTGYLLVLEPRPADALDLVIYKAVPKAELSITYTDAGDKVFNVTFNGTFDSTRNTNDYLFRWDSSYSWSQSSSSSSSISVSV